MNDQKAILENFDLKDEVTSEVRSATETIIQQLTDGSLRVCDPEHAFEVQAWIKKAVLVYFRIREVTDMSSPPFSFLDKVPLQQWSANQKVRAVPGAIVRRGAHVAPNCVLMPSFVNIGAYVGAGTMVDTWATVGSCAQVGKNVHLSGGVGLGGVLEPLQARPVVIEDHAFIGSRAIIVEGVRIGKSAVIGAGVILTASTRIIDVSGSVQKVYKGEVPDFSVVISGSISKKFPAGDYGVPAALIIGQRKASTDLKTSLNESLRDFHVPV